MVHNCFQINTDGKFEVKTVKNWMADKYKDDTKKLSRAYARVDSCADQCMLKCLTKSDIF